MRKPKVLVVNHFAVPNGQPGGTRHVELFSRMSGWRYLILAADRNHMTGERTASEPGFVTVRVTPYKSNGLVRILNWVSFAWSAFFRSCTVGRVDVVYASSPHLLAGLAGWLIAGLRRVPFVLEVRDLWPKVLVDMGQLAESSRLYRILSTLEGFLYARADLIVIMAEGSRTVLEARGVDPNKMQYVPNGADPHDFTPSDTREHLRAHYGFDRVTGIYAGAHGPANGLDLVIEAAARLRDLPLEIVLVGGGVSKVQLIEASEAQGLTNIRFRDPVPKSEIPDLLAAADFGLHILADVELFRTAISPNKLFDYMASNLPVITNSPGMVADIVEEAGCGIAVPPGDLALALAEMTMLSVSKRIDMGKTGKLWVAKNASRTSMAGRLAESLRAVTRNS